MKQIKTIILTAILLAFTLAGCSVGPTNDDLDNQWQVTSVVYNATGDESQPEGLYYCIYRDVIQLKSSAGIVTGQLIMADNKLTLNFPYISETDNVTTLNRWGIDSNPETFEVVALNSKQLILRSEFATVTMRCY